MLEVCVNSQRHSQCGAKRENVRNSELDKDVIVCGIFTLPLLQWIRIG